MLPLLLVFVLFLGSPEDGGAAEPDQLSPRWSSWFSTQEDASTNLKPAPGDTYQMIVAPTFYTRPTTLANVRELTLDAEHRRTQGMLATTTWLKGAFSTEAEVAINQGPHGAFHQGIPGDSRNDPSTRMTRLGLTGAAGTLRYGLRYRHAGQAFYNGEDRALKEVWGEWKQGRTTVTSAVGQQWNNVAADPRRVRIEENYSRLGLSWNKPAWPNFALTYQQKALNSLLDPQGSVPQKQHNQTLEAALGYTGSFWNARLAFSYSVQNDALRNGGESLIKNQTLTALFRPLNTLTIAPSLGYRTEEQDGTGVRIDSPFASLAMNYRQSQRLLISAIGNYSGMRSSDHVIDLENIEGKGILAWDLQQSQRWTTLLSLEAGFARTSNYLIPAAQTEDVSGILRLVLAPL
jgi:hypothetical protein